MDQCYQVPSGTYTYRYINVVDGGTLFFVDDGAEIDFRVSSLLVEQGGTLRAGAWCQPFGNSGGKLTIGLWGEDPTQQGSQPPSTPGIACKGNGGRCYDPSRVNKCCTGSDLTDPCNETCGSFQENALFEGYKNLNYDESFFGFKVLAVSYGGSVELFGKKGVANGDFVDPSDRQSACATPPNQYDVKEWALLSGGSWARLAQTAESGQKTLMLDRDVGAGNGGWESGDQLVVATTDWHPSHTELVTVASNQGSGSLELDADLGFLHNGELYQVPAALTSSTGNPNTVVDLRGVVGLLSRSIVIRSLGLTAENPFPAASECGSGSFFVPGCYFGGQVLARQGFGRFQAQGVELYQLGQGARMGHYPVHFHLAKSTAYTNAFVKDSSVWDSNTRFIVLHATHEVTLARNVGFLSVGHGYYLEDGSEIDNLLCHNLGVSAQGALEEYYQAQSSSSPTFRYVPPILDHAKGTQVAGSDSFMPVMYWTMNTYNDFVGNKAVGVHGYGSCFWLLGSGLSGPSQKLHWTTGSNTPADYAGFNQAGVRQAPLKRFRANSCSTAAYALQTTILTNPQVPINTGYTAVPNPYNQDPGNYDRPNVTGDFKPVKYGPKPICQQSTPPGGNWTSNVEYCVTTVVDRFTTSFNWAQVNFSSIWFRPWWYLFLNGAVTDQLFGGLTFVSGGNWAQMPPAYFTLAKDSVFIGTSQPAAHTFASATGPSIPGPSACTGPEACVLPEEGVGIFKNGFNPKRMINIYDGPFYAEGNIFLDTASFTCDPQSFSSCEAYLSTIQPGSASQMTVSDAAIGWKQPNGFYYPPAFAFKQTGFDQRSQRHNVIDPYRGYVQGTPAVPSAPTIFDPLYGNDPNVTPIDFSTILNDLDGTLTGMVSSAGSRTSSVSRNHYFDAPSQTPECKSFGVQTSPYEFATTVAAKLAKAGSDWTIDDTSWLRNGVFPTVPIYRQLTLEHDENCGSICSGDQWACTRGSFMAGTQNGEAPYLTMNQGVYYVDTDAQPPSCVKTSGFWSPGFEAGDTYLLYHLYAKDDTKVTYQVYVGDDFQPEEDGFWARVNPHVNTGNNLQVVPFQNPQGSVSVQDGILTVVLDNTLIQGDFAFKARAADEKCLPRDVCAISTDGSRCTLSASFSEDDLKQTVEQACEYWATLTSGTLSGSTDHLSLADCPADGCLGYAFTLPATFTPQPYSQVGNNLATCFPDSSTWNVPLRRVDDSCPLPEAPVFCSASPPER